MNNTGYQATIDLRPEIVAADAVSFPIPQRGYSQYDLPTKLHPQPRTCCVVGAGSGNDAAGLLRNGASESSRSRSTRASSSSARGCTPNSPTKIPRCIVVNDDARSYFATSNEKFDVIAFGLLDSHTTTAMTNARLDHYVYTQREHRIRRGSSLNPGGMVVLSFEAAQAVHRRPDGVAL